MCHTQMVRTLASETARYGHYSVAGEDVYERPFLWGSKRTGPDLARVGGRYSDEWHAAHLADPRSVVPVSNMPAYPWLFERRLTGADTAAKLSVLRRLGTPYSDADIEGAAAAVAGKSEAEALIAYLQSLGQDMQNFEGRAMSLQLIALLLVTVAFVALVAWVYAPRNRKRLDDASRLPLDDEEESR